jgi:hypothetical protein
VRNKCRGGFAMATTENINQFMESVTSNNITFNRDIVAKDLNGNTEIIVKCYCTIVAEETISHYMQVIKQEIFNTNKEAIQPEINKFVEEAKILAQTYNVPIIM